MAHKTLETRTSRDEREDPERVLLRDKVIAYLKKPDVGIIHETDDGDVWDADAAYELFFDKQEFTQISSGGRRFSLDKQRFFDLFKYETVLTSGHVSGKPYETRLFFCPANRAELEDIDALSDLYRQSPWGPWNMGKIKSWDDRVMLASGETITLRELWNAYAQVREHVEPDEVEEELRDAVRDKLLEIGIIRQQDIQGETVDVWDIDMVQTLDKSLLDRIYPSKIGGPRREKGRKIENVSDLIHLFRNEKVLSLKDVEAGSVKKKYLFALPDRAIDAFDPKAIKKTLAASHLIPSHVGKHVSTWGKTIACRRGEEISFAELHVAQTLVGDLNARRVGEKLMVPQKDGTLVPFSVTRFESQIKIAALLNNPAEYARENLGRLLDADILRLSDFGATAEKGGRIVRTEYRIRTNGEVYIKGIRYSLGREFDTRGDEADGTPVVWHATELTPDIAGILGTSRDGSKELVAAFRLVPPEEVDVRKERAVEAYRNKHGIEPKVKSLSLLARVGTYEIEWIAQDALFGKRRSGEERDTFNARSDREGDFTAVQSITAALAQQEGIGIHRLLSVREQLLLASVARESGNTERILAATKQFGQDFLHAFLVCDLGPDYEHTLLSLAEQLDPSSGRAFFKSFAGYTRDAAALAKRTVHGSRLPFSEEDLTSVLMARGKEYFLDVSDRIDNGVSPASAVKELLFELSGETPDESVLKSVCADIARLFNQQNIRLNEYHASQEHVTKALLSDPEKQTLALNLFDRMGALKPIPEIHWRVDRTSEEYNRRLGVDLAGVLKDRSRGRKKQNLLEIGMGSGVSKSERAISRFGGSYADFALADRVYYPLAPVIEKMIDFSNLEKETGRLSSTDRQLVADIVYKTLVIREGQTAKDAFAYDERVQELLTEDINALKGLLPEAFSRLADVDMVPSTISSRTAKGEVVYPNKIPRDSWPTQVKAAIDRLSANSGHYINSEWRDKDLHGAIDAFPANVIIGDMRDITRVAPDQIDVELGVRSTMYVRGEEYEQLLRDLFSRLAPGGMMLDDSIRDNDGWTYRFAEVSRAFAGEKDAETLVILGPGFSGEDHRKDSVPLSIAVTKKGSSRDVLEKYAAKGCVIKHLSEILTDTAYLKSLDTTGVTFQKVREVVEPAKQPKNLRAA